MNKTDRPKILILIETLSQGGAERAAANLSFLLEEIGFEIVVGVLHNQVDYDYAGQLVPLGKRNFNSRKERIRALCLLFKLIWSSKFDLIIDFRMRTNSLRELLLAAFLFPRRKTLARVAVAKVEWYIPKPKWIFNRIFNSYLGVISVSKGITKILQEALDLSNVHTIYNSIDIPTIQSLCKQPTVPLPDDYVVAAGKTNAAYQKQIDKLLKAYAKSALPHKGISLVLLGNLDTNLYRDLLEKWNIYDKVKFMGYQLNPFPIFSKARFFVLSSRFEGLPNVLIEALACGIPVISFDCPTGPSEIISNGVNGILVNNQDIEGLIQAMNTMITDDSFYSTCKKNALKSISGFGRPVVKQEWLTLLESIGLIPYK